MPSQSLARCCSGSGATCTMWQKIFLQWICTVTVFLSIEPEAGKYMAEFASKRLQLSSFSVVTKDATTAVSSVNSIHHWSHLGSYSWEAWKINSARKTSKATLGILLVICTVQQPSQDANQNHLLSEEAWAKLRVPYESGWLTVKCTLLKEKSCLHKEHFIKFL